LTEETLEVITGVLIIAVHPEGAVIEIDTVSEVKN